MPSRIQWTEETWNPVTGCTKVSAGCKNCYAEQMAKRLKAMGQEKYRNGFEATVHPEALSAPLRWRKPRRIFVNSMSDLFHGRVKNEFIAAVFGVMAACPQHTFQILTKRPERAVKWFEWAAKQEPAAGCDAPWARLEVCWQALVYEATHHSERDGGPLHIKHSADPDGPWPLPNVWFGVSVEEPSALWRIDDLEKIPAAVRFVSFEPLLSGMHQIDWTGIHWAIIGCESGSKARPCELDWIRGIRAQCKSWGIPLFVKQARIDGKLVKMPKLDGRVWAEYPR